MIFPLSGGQTGATLTVTSSGAGTITVSNTTLGKSYSKSVTAGGSAVFKGLQTGTWTVTLTDGTQTSTKTVVITSDYSTNIAYFSASINITYPATSTCVVTDSGGQTVASDSNITSSTKTWTATVNATGTYTVTATDSVDPTKTKSQSVSIVSDGQSAQIELSYDILLYKSGEGAIVEFDTAREANSSIRITSDAITTNFTSNTGYQIACITPKMDLTEFTRLSVIANCTEVGSSTDYAGILGVFAGTTTATALAAAENSDTIVIAKTYFTVKNGEFDLDITNISGEYKVGIKGGLKSTISEIRLRR